MHVSTNFCLNLMGRKKENESDMQAAEKWSFLYIVLRLTYIRGLILELSRNFPIVVAVKIPIKRRYALYGRTLHLVKF